MFWSGEPTVHLCENVLSCSLSIFRCVEGCLKDGFCEGCFCEGSGVWPHDWH